MASPNEPGAEEGGEDIFAMPDKCSIFGCDGRVRAEDGFMKCSECGSSYGPDPDPVCDRCGDNCCGCYADEAEAHDD